MPVEYFHVVFTGPAQIAEIAFFNKEVVYNILFRATAETLLTIAGDPQHPGAGIGFFAVLHTWGQNLLHHPQSKGAYFNASIRHRFACSKILPASGPTPHWRGSDVRSAEMNLP